MAKILIIDDDPVARDLLVTVLGYAGHQLIQAVDGADGLARTKAEAPELIIVDLLMPTMDGFEFVRRVREDPSLASTPVVFYSATYLESEARNLASLCGVKHIITKPAEPQQILKTVGAALGKAQTPVGPLPLETFHRQHSDLLTTKLSQKAAEAIPRLDAMITLHLRFAAEHDPKRLLETFCAGVREIVGARAAIVAVGDSSTQDVHHIVTSGISRSKNSATAGWKINDGVLGSVLRDSRPQRLSDINVDPKSLGLPPDHPAVHSLLCVPIVSPGKTHGCLCLTDKIGSSGFSDEDEGLAQIMAAQVGRAYENSSLYSELKTYAENLEREVIERKRAEEALRQSEERFSKAFRANLAAIGIQRIDDGRLIDVNQQYCDFFGYSREEMIGRTFQELNLWANPEDRKRIMQAVSQEGHILNVEARMLRKSGEHRDALLSIETIELSGKPHHIAMLIDLTERKRLEEQLRRAQKMEAIGQLAGGVAHDFNNILTVILGNALLIQTTQGLPPAVTEAVQQIGLASEQASGLTRQLLMFSRRQAMQPKSVDLSDVVGNMVKMLWRILGEDIKLQFEPLANLPLIRADAGMIEQVVMNLAINARDAMPKGGQLTIRTGTAKIDENFVMKNPEASAGDFVYLQVSDTGLGIPPENLSKIFEPFFTTKGDGKGTGLGLATVYGITRQHRGWIKVASEVNRGTTFTAYLPALEGQAEAQRPGTAQPVVQGGHETILVVEDHPLLRSIVKKVLERYGYRIHEATSAVEALKIWDEHREEIQLLLTDVIMPDGMTGRELAEKLLAENPRLKVIYTSGFSTEIMGKGIWLQEGVNFLTKPYDLRKVVETVRKALER